MAKKKSRKKSSVDALRDFLIYEATGGALGRVPPAAKNEDGTLKESGVSFRDRAKLYDSAVKHESSKEPEEDDNEDGIASFKERLNDRGGGTNERGADDAEGDDSV